MSWAKGCEARREEPLFRVCLGKPQPEGDIGGAVAMSAAHIRALVDSITEIPNGARVLLQTENAHVQCCAFTEDEIDAVLFVYEMIRRWEKLHAQRSCQVPTLLCVQLLNAATPEFLRAVQSAIDVMAMYLLEFSTMAIYLTTPGASDARLRTPKPLLVIRPASHRDQFVFQTPSLKEHFRWLFAL